MHRHQARDVVCRQVDKRNRVVLDRSVRARLEKRAMVIERGAGVRTTGAQQRIATTAGDAVPMGQLLARLRGASLLGDTQRVRLELSPTCRVDAEHWQQLWVATRVSVRRLLLGAAGVGAVDKRSELTGPCGVLSGMFT